MIRYFVLLSLVVFCFPSGLIAQGNTDIAALELEVHNQINQYRVGKGLRELKPNNAIRNEALTHSKNMASGKVPFSHKGFDERFNKLATIFNISSGSENVANGPADAKTIVEGWLASPKHKENIEGDFNMTGIGIAQAKNGTFFYTQLFVKSPEKPKIVVDEFENDLLRLINEHRKSLGLSGFSKNELIKVEALKYSEQMAAGRVPIGPPSFDSPIRRLVQTMNAKAMAELIGYGFNTPKEVFDSWMASSKQRETIEGSYDLTGIGITQSKDGKVFVTQVFILSR
ncbi:MAG: CAP domain-containing protein [Bacteroidales bacterium]|nr:MAG: CAP domain-containing protein [Bacteroidales bacterium]